MTTQPTPAQQTADTFREEIKTTLRTIQNRIEQLTKEIGAITNIQADERNTLDELTKSIDTVLYGLRHAATATPPNVGTFSEMMIDCVIMTYDDNGKPTFKATGTPYNKFGVRIWDEVLPILGIDPAKLKPGKNAIEPIRARILMNEPEEGKTAQPRKVTGRM